MKVLGISCSLREGGNSEILIREALASAGRAGAETEFLSLVGKTIRPCEGCYACLPKGRCKVEDDMQDIFPGFWRPMALSSQRRSTCGPFRGWQRYSSTGPFP